tara:strand:+ start:416 stop:829 length:414 start_codon:yes stop_codon:yes gene_type:complete
LKRILVTIFASALVSCVGPADPDHGLVENLPVVINKNDVFSLSLRADNFSINQIFTLSLSIPSNKKILSTLIVTDFSSTDSSVIQILGENDSTIFNYMIESNKTLSSSSNYSASKKGLISLNSFSGIINWVVTATSE